MKREAEPGDAGARTEKVQPRMHVLAPHSTRALRRTTIVIAGLIGLAILKPWGPGETPVARPELRTVVLASAVPRPPEDPIEAICTASRSWRVASVGHFVGRSLREWGFITPVAALGPSDPSIPFVVFGFTRVLALGYCAPSETPPSGDFEVVVFRLDAAGLGTTVRVTRAARTPVTSVAGLFSITLTGGANLPPSGGAASGGAASGEGADGPGWPPGRYVFALRGADFEAVWFGADLRERKSAPLSQRS